MLTLSQQILHHFSSPHFSKDVTSSSRLLPNPTNLPTLAKWKSLCLVVLKKNSQGSLCGWLRSHGHPEPITVAKDMECLSHTLLPCGTRGEVSPTQVWWTEDRRGLSQRKIRIVARKWGNGSQPGIDPSCPWPQTDRLRVFLVWHYHGPFWASLPHS